MTTYHEIQISLGGRADARKDKNRPELYTTAVAIVTNSKCGLDKRCNLWVTYLLCLLTCRN